MCCLKGRIVQPPKTGLKCTSAAAPTLQQTVACQSCPLTTPGLRKDIRHQIRHLYSNQVTYVQIIIYYRHIYYHILALIILFLLLIFYIFLYRFISVL